MAPDDQLRVPYPTDLSGPQHYILPEDKSHRMVIFFGAKDLAEGSFNFFQLGRELKENRVFVNNGANDWYQFGVPGLGGSFDETVEMLKRWRDAFEAEEICAIGTSMGGYAAIQYGAAIGARILAFSTDVVLGSPYSQSSKYYTGVDPPSCADLRRVISGASPDVTLFVGERDAVDIHSAHQLRQAGELTAVSLIGADHIVPSFLSRRARLGPLLRSFVAGEGAGSQEGAGAALDMQGYPEAAFAAYCASQENDWRRVEECARAALAAYPYGEAAELLLGQTLLKQDRFGEAAEVLALAFASQPNDVEGLSLLATAIRRGGHAVRARHLYHQALTLKPGHHQSHYGLCLLHLAEGDLAAARRAVVQALRMAPKNQDYQKRLDGIRSRMKGSEEKSACAG